MARREIKIIIVNDTPFPMEKLYASTSHGTWQGDDEPPDVIPARGAEGTWGLETRGSPFGGGLYGIDETSSYVVVDDGRMEQADAHLAFEMLSC